MGPINTFIYKALERDALDVDTLRDCLKLNLNFLMHVRLASPKGIEEKEMKLSEFYETLMFNKEVDIVRCRPLEKQRLKIKRHWK